MKAKAKAIRNTFALDIGTTKFCLAALRESQGPGTYVVETLSVPAAGMRRGMLSNLEAARRALQSLLESAEREFDADIDRVVVGIAGSHLKSRLVTASLSLDTSRVREEDVKRLIERVEGEQAGDSRELLHIVPLGYRVDARETVDDATGFTGRTLFGDFFLIDADKYYLKDMVDLCNDAGLAVKRLYSEPFASASVTVPDPYKELGCAVADIGGGTTDGLVFHKGKPRAVFTVNIAGKLMTSDLAIGLNTSPEEAERLKLTFGLGSSQTDVEVFDLKGMPRRYGPREIGPILGPRIQELAAHIGRNLMTFKGALGAGLLLTGGGAEVDGIAPFMEKKLGVPVKKAKPSMNAPANANHSLSTQEATNGNQYGTRFATAVGLLNLELGRIEEDFSKKRASLSGRYLGQFLNWIKELS